MGEATYGHGWASKKTMLFCEDPLRRADLSEMARVCGLVPTEQGDGADMIVADIRANPALLERISKYQQSHSTPLLVWTDLEQIDDAYAALADGETHWLIDGNGHDALALLATLARRPKTQSVREDGVVDYAALHRISDGLADFAEMLANMAGETRKAAAPALHAPVSFRKSTPSASTAPLDPAQIRELIQARRLRDAFFQPGLFGEPAWDILLDLMLAKLERTNVSVSSLCIAAAVPPTTALRCITGMTEGGLLERSADPNDARRIFISLSSGTEAAMRRYLAEILP